MFANRYGLEYDRISQRPEDTLADQTRHIDVARCSVVVFEMERVFRPRCHAEQLSYRMVPAGICPNAVLGHVTSRSTQSPADRLGRGAPEREAEASRAGRSQTEPGNEMNVSAEVKTELLQPKLTLLASVQGLGTERAKEPSDTKIAGSEPPTYNRA